MTDAIRIGRSVARRVALDGLSVAARWSGRERDGVRRPRVQFVYLHALPPGQEQRFDAWLGWLLSEHQPLSYGAAVERVLSGPIDRPYVALSLDDAFSSCLRVAETLERRGMSACFFVPTGFVGTTTVKAARQFFGTAAGVHEPAMTWGDLERLVATGHEVGSHTHSHPDLGVASRTEVEHEVGRSVEALRSRLGSCRHFAWPLGTFRHFSAAGAQAVLSPATGLVSCASAVRGAHSVVAADQQHLCIRRDHIPAEWPHRHGRYFVARAGARSTAGDNSWPASWQLGP